MSALAFADIESPPVRLTVDQYHGMIAAGVLDADSRCELLDGLLVEKPMSHDPTHDGPLVLLLELLAERLPKAWQVRPQCATTFGPASEPEPGLAVVRRDPGRYLTRHPGPADVGLLVEVANSSLADDRRIKGLIYARAGVPLYWIVNVTSRQVEVYSQPDNAGYGRRDNYGTNQSLPPILDGQQIAELAVTEVLP